jgi:hypothetical protein
MIHMTPNVVGLGFEGDPPNTRSLHVYMFDTVTQMRRVIWNRGSSSTAKYKYDGPFETQKNYLMGTLLPIDAIFPVPIVDGQYTLVIEIGGTLDDTLLYSQPVILQVATNADAIVATQDASLPPPSDCYDEPGPTAVYGSYSCSESWMSEYCTEYGVSTVCRKLCGTCDDASRRLAESSTRAKEVILAEMDARAGKL